MAHTLRSLSADKIVKKVDGFRARLDQINIVDGFNERRQDDHLSLWGGEMTIKETRKRLSEATEAYKTALPGRDLTEARAELTIARMGYQIECAQIVERLGDVLEPFAKEAGAWHPTTKDGESIACVRDMADYIEQDDRFLTVGDLRALAALYEEVR